MKRRNRDQFVMRVEDELRRRRDRVLGRCGGCGKTIDRHGDYAKVAGALMHTACLSVPAADRAY